MYRHARYGRCSQTCFVDSAREVMSKRPLRYQKPRLLFACIRRAYPNFLHRVPKTREKPEVGFHILLILCRRMVNTSRVDVRQRRLASGTASNQINKRTGWREVRGTRGLQLVTANPRSLAKLVQQGAGAPNRFG